MNQETLAQITKTVFQGAGEIPQWLQVVVAHAEDLNSVPSIHIVAHIHP